MGNEGLKSSRQKGTWLVGRLCTHLAKQSHGWFERSSGDISCGCWHMTLLEGGACGCCFSCSPPRPVCWLATFSRVFHERKVFCISREGLVLLVCRVNDLSVPIHEISCCGDLLNPTQKRSDWISWPPNIYRKSQIMTRFDSQSNPNTLQGTKKSLWYGSSCTSRSDLICGWDWITGVGFGGEGIFIQTRGI